jgi:lipopolysaccharide export system permease protein
MFDGTVEQSSHSGGQLTVLKFQRDVFDLDQFAGPARATDRATSERYLSELFWPDPKLLPKLRNAYIAEGHNRLSQPLYCIAFALIALAAVLRGRRARGANALRLVLAALGAAMVRIAGYGVQGLAVGAPSLVFLFYLMPLLGAAIALAALAGVNPAQWFRRSEPAEALS